MRRFSVAFLWCMLALPAASRADVLYHQPYFTSSARISDYGVGDGSGFRMYDDFTLALDARVERVSFLATWLGPADPGAAAPSPDPLSWEFGFFADANNEPGAALSVQVLAPAAVSTTYQGSTVFTFGPNDSRNVNLYVITADLPTAFWATGGTRYWFSPFTSSASLTPALAWLGDNPNLPNVGDSRSLQRTLGPGRVVTGTTVVGQDRALLLEGSTVPEPATLALMATGAALVSVRRRRRM